MSSLESQISDHLDTYISYFNKSDFANAAAYYHEPAVAISSGGVSILPGRKDLQDYFATTVKRLREDGFDHSEWGGPKKIIVLDEKGLVLASCTCKRLRKDGTSCETFTATYTLRNVDGHGWLIAAIHHHPFENQLK